ncbi:unnamed protein product [Musa acuminata subsp. burmannicoides]
METELPFGSPRKQPSFFEPIYKELKKKIRKVKKNSLKVSKEKTRWVIKIVLVLKRVLKRIVLVLKRTVLVLKRIMKKLEKVNQISLFELRKGKVHEPNENAKDSKKNNQIIHESTIQIRSMNWTNYLLIEKKMKDLADKTITIRNQIEGITKDKKKIVLAYHDKRPELQNIFGRYFKEKYPINTQITLFYEIFH